MKNKLIPAMLVLVGASVVLFADAPAVTVDQSRHGNLARAQRSIQAAWSSINTAQRDNRYHLGGHAEKAKELLAQANQEIQYAADSADGR